MNLELRGNKLVAGTMAYRVLGGTVNGVGEGSQGQMVMNIQIYGIRTWGILQSTLRGVWKNLGSGFSTL